MSYDLASLVEHRHTINADDALDEASTSVRHLSHEYYAAISADRKVLGLCSLAHIRQLLSGRYGFALHARASVREHLVPGKNGCSDSCQQSGWCKLSPS